MRALNRSSSILVLFSLMIVLSCKDNVRLDRPSVIPVPAHMVMGNGYFELKSGLVIFSTRPDTGWMSATQVRLSGMLQKPLKLFCKYLGNL